jgi:hypothetical protein
MTLNFGYIINAGVDFLSNDKNHEWVNALLMQLGYSSTPVVDALIKSSDTIDLKSTYLYHIPAVHWFGPFVAFRLTAPMLSGYDVRADDSNVLRLDHDEEQLFDNSTDPPRLIDENGATIDASHPDVKTIRSGNRIELTEAFAPLTLRESVGLFALPVNKPLFKLDIRLGFGAWETFVRGGYTLDDNEDTGDILELRQMQDSNQIGPELGALISGKWKTIILYSLSALLMQPVYQSADTELEGFELLNVEFDAMLGVKIFEWASLDYTLKAYKQPLIVDDWQIQNTLMFTVNFTIVGGAEPPPPPPPPCKCPETPPKAPEEKSKSEDAPASSDPPPSESEKPSTEPANESAATNEAGQPEPAASDEAGQPDAEPKEAESITP